MTTGMPPARGGSPRPRGSSSGALERVAPPAKLACVAGPKAGEEYVLTDDEVVIGRAVENAVSIPDTSVSRRHVMLRKVSRGWMVSDLGSGNGTQVNGEALEQERLLRNGDVITLGDTELSFVDQSAPPRPVDKPRVSSSDLVATRSRVPPTRGPRVSRGAIRASTPEGQASRRKVVWGVIAFLVLGFVGLAGLKWRQKKMEAGRNAANASVLASRSEQGALFQEGKNLVREEKWSEAKAKFDEVLALNPNYPTLQNYLDRATKELPNEEHLNAADQALAKKEIGKAAAELALVTSDTQMDQRVRKARATLEERTTARLLEARGLMDNGGVKDAAKMKKLGEIADDVLKGSPDNRDALEMSKQAKDNLAALSKPVASTGSAGPAPKAWLEVADRFREGDVTGALALANECATKRISQCRSLPMQITSFSEKFKSLETLSDRELEALDELDQKIGGGQSSKMGRQIGTRLNAGLYKRASAAKASGDWARAMEFARKILKHDSGNSAAQSIVSEARGKAKDLYLQAYAMKESTPDEALRLFKDVMQMTPKDEELHVKAENWVQKLQK